MFSLEKRKLRGILLRPVKSLVGSGKDDAGGLFLVMATGKRRGNGHKVKYRKICLNIRRSF